MVIWCRDDYIKEAENQVKDNTIYKDVSFKETMLSDLVDKSNKCFKSLHSRKCITEKELKYFSYQFKKTTNLGKLYLSPKIHKRLSNVPGRPVISNCGTPTEKTSEFLDFYLKPLMQNGWSYIRDSGDFTDKMKRIGKIPEGSFLVTADVVGLYPSIPHIEGISTLKRKLEEQPSTKIPTNDLVKLAEFVLKNNLFEFNDKVKQQISGTAIGTKFAPPYTCIYMDKTETDFLKTQHLQPFIWLRYIDDIYFIRTYGQAELKRFMEKLNKFLPNLKFTYESSRKKVAFLDLNVSLGNGCITIDLYTKSTDCHQYLHCSSSHTDHLKRSIIYSQALRLSNICTYDRDFQMHALDMKSWVLERG